MTNLYRGLLAGVSIDELQERTTHPPYRPYWDRLTRRWRVVDAGEEETGKFLDIGSCAGGQFTWLVREAARPSFECVWQLAPAMSSGRLTASTATCHGRMCSPSTKPCGTMGCTADSAKARQ